jgi:SAM-dependent methyltransferase
VSGPRKLAPTPLTADFPSRIERNNAYYARYWAKVENRTEARDYSRALGEFSARLLPRSTVLDIGCGTGHHLMELAERGFNVLGIDPSPTMRFAARSKGFEVIDGAFETLELIKLPPIVGIWSAASLLHVPQSLLQHAIEVIARLLPPEGCFFTTVRVGTGASWDRWDQLDIESGDERFIQLFEPAEIREALSGAKLKIVEEWSEESTWGRASEWYSVVAVPDGNPGKGRR